MTLRANWLGSKPDSSRRRRVYLVPGFTGAQVAQERRPLEELGHQRAAAWTQLGSSFGHALGGVAPAVDQRSCSM